MAVAVPVGAERTLREGGLAILPTDTVYGIACAAADAGACSRLYQLKRRPKEQPTAIMLGSLEALLGDALPATPASAGAVCRMLLPGPLTLIVPNPGRRFAHICGHEPDRIGVRVPALDPALARLADAVGGLLITSANLRGEPAPARFLDVPSKLVAACRLAVDGGDLTGTASAVIDVTGPEPKLLRDGPNADAAMADLASGRRQPQG